MTRKRTNLPALFIYAVFLLAFALIARFAWLAKCATFDEPLHFVSSWTVVHDLDFRCDAEDPPLWKYYVAAGTDSSAMPIDRQSPLWNQMLNNVVEGAFTFQTLYQQPGVDAIGLIDSARARMIGLAIALGALIAWWAWRIAGPVAGVVAVLAFSLDPNFLAHGALIKNDVPMSLALLALFAIVWLVGERMTIARGVLLCLMLGIVLTTKFSGVAAVPMVAAALAIRAILPQPWPILKKTVQSRPQKLLAAAILMVAALIVCYLSIWAVYGFRFAPGASASDLFDIRQYNDIVAQRQVTVSTGAPAIVPLGSPGMSDWSPHGTARFIDWLNDHRLLPQSWLMGFLYTYGTTLLRDAFFCGEVRNSGWWYYFPLAMAFKTPLATIAALALACISFGFFHSDNSPNRRARRGLCAVVLVLAIGIPLLLFPLFHPGLREYVPVFTCAIFSLFLISMAALAYRFIASPIGNPWPVIAAAIGPMMYMALAMRSHFNLGIRHVLPVYPFLFIFLGVAAARGIGRWPRATSILLVCFLLGLATETFSAYPDFIPFFNAAVGGSRSGIHLLSDSNIDWGQELPDLAQWQRQNPGVDLYVKYFGQVDPAIYHINSRSIRDVDVRKIMRDTPSAVFAISAVALQNTYLDSSGVDQIAPFRQMRPLTVLGGSMYLFSAKPPHE